MFRWLYAVIEGIMDIDDKEEKEEIDDESGEGDDMGDLGDDDDLEEGEDSDDDEDISRSYDEDSSGSDDEDSNGSDDDVDIEDVKKMERFARTFHNGDYDQELDDEFSLKESGSLIHIRATQASYNKPNDWVESPTDAELH
jgi:hypothetical protein